MAAPARAGASAGGRCVMNTREILKRWIGYDADEIARIIQDRGIKGRPTNTTTCPVARYLKRVAIPTPNFLSVASREVHYAYRDEYVQTAPLPLGASAFI